MAEIDPVQSKNGFDNFDSVAIATNTGTIIIRLLCLKNATQKQGQGTWGTRLTQDMYAQSKKELEEANKSRIALKTECSTLDYNQREALNCTLTTCLDQIKKMNEELFKIAQDDDCECSQLKAQIALLYQEKIKIQQCEIQLNSRVENLESHVGFEKE